MDIAKVDLLLVQKISKRHFLRDIKKSFFSCFRALDASGSKNTGIHSFLYFVVIVLQVQKINFDMGPAI